MAEVKERTIPLDEAEDYVYGGLLASQKVSEHRWYNKQLIVFQEQEDASLWGFYYLDPKSELQEDQDRFESDPVRIFPVVAKEVTTTVYEKEAANG